MPPILPIASLLVTAFLIVRGTITSKGITMSNIDNPVLYINILSKYLVIHSLIIKSVF